MKIYEVKMKKKTLIPLLFLTIFIIDDGFAASGAAFLKISPGAKPIGMGGAYTAFMGDINSLYYNPAGIASIDGSQVGAMHTEWITDINYSNAGGAFSFREGVLGVSATLLGMGDIDGRGEDREKTEDFTASDFLLQFSYAKALVSGYQAGGSFKYIRQKIADESASGIALDMGLQKSVISNLNMGISLRNLGPNMRFISESYSLPLTFALGTSYRIGGVSIGFDTNYEIIDENIKVFFGTEYLPVQFLSIRGGYCVNALSSISGRDSEVFEVKDGLGGGVGLNILSYSIDYAIVPYVDFGNTHRISLIARF